VLEACPLPDGDRVAIVGNAVGPNVLVADACIAAGLTVPDPTESGLAANPVHLASTVAVDAFEAALRAAVASDGIDAVVAVVVPLPGHDAEADALRRVVGTVAGASTKPVVASVLGQRALIGHAGTVPTFAFAEHAAMALGRVAAYARWRRRPAGEFTELTGIDTAAARHAVAAVLAARPDGGSLDPSTVATVLSAAGITVTALAAGTPGDAVAAAIRLDSDPAFGPLVTFEIASRHRELLRDAAVCVAPLTDVDAAELVRSLRTSPLWFGYGDAAPLATGALEELLVRVARLADEVPEISRCSLDPVVITATGVVITGASLEVAPVTNVPTDVRRMRDA